MNHEKSIRIPGGQSIYLLVFHPFIAVGDMRDHLITLGAILFLVGILLTVATFGIGIICAGPLILIGIFLFLLGFVLPHEGRQGPVPPPPEGPRDKRYCTNCGREIPLDANVCPYCGKDFRVK